jgi:hypothetical protein
MDSGLLKTNAMVQLNQLSICMVTRYIPKQKYNIKIEAEITSKD